MTMQHILLTTDQSEESLRAFGPTAELARALQARITLLQVVLDEPHLAAPASAAMPATHMVPEQAAQTAQEAMTQLREQLRGVERVDIEAVVGVDVPGTIVSRAKELGADLICMATHGRSGIKRLLLGSVAEQVVRHATVPVTLYPPPEE